MIFDITHLSQLPHCSLQFIWSNSSTSNFLFINLYHYSLHTNQISFILSFPSYVYIIPTIFTSPNPSTWITDTHFYPLTHHLYPLGVLPSRMPTIWQNYWLILLPSYKSTPILFCLPLLPISGCEMAWILPFPLLQWFACKSSPPINNDGGGCKPRRWFMIHTRKWEEGEELCASKESGHWKHAKVHSPL